jgi:hypothetical protein
MSTTIGLIDHYATSLSILIGIAAWAYIGSRQAPAAFCRAYHQRLRRCALLCMVATLALIGSVVSDGALTAIRLSGTQMSADFLVPIVSMAIEIACVGVLILWIRSMVQRTAAIAALLRG